jgi:cell division septum initiation protein DivIVA
MPQRSKISLLPTEIRVELERRLITSGFSNYSKIAQWLREQDVDISRTAVALYGQKFEDKIKAVKDATDMAIVLTDRVGDDAGKMNDAIVRMYQEKLFKVFAEMKDLDSESIDFIKLGRAIADVNRSSLSQKKWLAEARKKAIEDAANSIEETAKQEGVSPATINKIRRDVLKMAQ